MSTVMDPPQLLTPDDVLEMAEGKDCELVDGQLMKKPMGSRSQDIGTRISRILGNYCEPIGLAHVFSEEGYVCFPSKPKQMRRPDVSCILTARLPFENIGDGYSKIRPDLAVEVISPHDLAVDLEIKLDDYRDAEIPLVWLVYPSLKRVRVIWLDRSQTDLGPDDLLTGEDVLPGFSCRVGALFGPASA